jgi:meiotically up-regulated gene 157 (Mug157) protein
VLTEPSGLKEHHMTKTAEQLRTEILSAIDKNIADLRAALASCQEGEIIYAWINSGLGVKLDAAGNPSVVGTAYATIVDRDDMRTFSNGANFQAIKVFRKLALTKALESSEASRAHLATMPIPSEQEG